MTYIYTERNRLEKPHNYMYTEYEGVSLLQSYQSDRLLTLQSILDLGFEGEVSSLTLSTDLITCLEKNFDRISSLASDKFRMMLTNQKISLTNNKAESNNEKVLSHARLLSEYTDLEEVTTIDLLHALIAAQLTGQYHILIKEWIDRLTQRFEVTKKIYETYPTGFRKGTGSNDSIRLYWLFALNLSLYYTDSQHIKYLSTLLKVCDLLCSLPEELHSEQISSKTMALILATEIISVQLLIEKKRI